MGVLTRSRTQRQHPTAKARLAPMCQSAAESYCSFPRGKSMRRGPDCRQTPHFPRDLRDLEHIAGKRAGPAGVLSLFGGSSGTSRVISNVQRRGGGRGVLAAHVLRYRSRTGASKRREGTLVAFTRWTTSSIETSPRALRILMRWLLHTITYPEKSGEPGSAGSLDHSMRNKAKRKPVTVVDCQTLGK